MVVILAGYFMVQSLCLDGAEIVLGADGVRSIIIYEYEKVEAPQNPFLVFRVE